MIIFYLETNTMMVCMYTHTHINNEMVNYIPKLSKDDYEHMLSGGFHDSIIAEYIRFLTLVKVCGSGAPSKAVDEVWCHHISNTDMYRLFCERNFVEFINRNPAIITRDKYVDTLEKLMALALAASAPASSPWWPADDYRNIVCQSNTSDQYN